MKPSSDLYTAKSSSLNNL